MTYEGRGRATLCKQEVTHDQRATMEWLLSTEQLKHWVTQVSAHRKPSSTISPKQVVSDLKQFLIEHNLYIGPTTFTSGFISVVHKACRSNNFKFVKFVLKHHKGKFDINQLVSSPPYPNFIEHQHHNVTIIASDKHEETLVHAVVNDPIAESTSTKIITLLVSHGASVNIPDSSSVTPLLRAVEKYSPNKDIINYLIKVGADVHYQDNKGQSVLMYVVSGSAQAVKDIILLLLKVGADPTLTDERGYNVLHHAICNSYKSVYNLSVLLSAKVPPKLFSPTSLVQALFFADKRNFICDFEAFMVTDPPQPLNNPKKITEVIAKHPRCPPRLKVDSILVNATFSLYWDMYINSPPADSIKACYDLIKEGLTLQAKLKLPPPIILEPIEDYGGLSEVTSIEELNEKYSDLTNTTTQVNLAYQCLIIRERCLGYGDFTVIGSLFMYGKWMIVLDHFLKGLCLWLRGTQMLLSHFKEGIRSEQHELIQLIKNGYFCISRKIDKVINVLQMFHDLSTTFEQIVCNFLECQRQSMEMLVNEKEVNIHCRVDRVISYFNWKSSFWLLNKLSNNPQHTIDVTSLCCQFIEKCSEFQIGSILRMHVLDIVTSDSYSSCFLSILLESGGNRFVNKVGWTGYRPLKLAKTKEATFLLLAHGAHLDAVSKPHLFERCGPISLNPYLDDYFSIPLPLTCLSAKCIVSESIPYQSIDLPRHIIEFIALHDPNDIQSIDATSADSFPLSMLQFW